MSAELVCAATDPAWLDKRREGITATDIVTIAGLVTWDSPWALYHRKLGLLPEVEQSDRMWVGSMLEKAIAERWSRDRGFLCTGGLRDGGLYCNSDRIWQMATPDALTIRSNVNSQQAGEPLECKTADRYQKGWGADGTDEVPAHVRAQVLWQMDTLGVGAGHVAVVFLPSGEFRSYTIRHDHPTGWHDEATGLISGPIACPVCDEIDGLRDLGFGFWTRVQRREPPDLDGLEVTTDALRYLHPGPSEASAEIAYGLIYAYDAAAKAKREAEQQYRLAQQIIRDVMGDAHEAVNNGKPVFRRTIGKRAGYYVQPSEIDTLRRIGKEKDGDS